MIKSVLVPIMGTDSDRIVMTCALSIARRFSAHLDVLHVRTDLDRLLAAAALGDFGDVTVLSSLRESFEKQAEERCKKARTLFSSFISEEKLETYDVPAAHDEVSVAWCEETGDEAERVAHLGRFHDLIVVTRPDEADVLRLQTLESALMESGRPIVIAPAKPFKSVGRNIALAWKDKPEAARAMTAAMPFFAAAESVTVIEVREGAVAVDDRSVSTERIVKQFAWHHIEANRQVVSAVSRSGPEALLVAVRGVGADLLVMGAYGHSRLREMIFGGFTDYVLREAGVPVLMFH